MGHDDHSVVLFQLAHQLLHLHGGARVQGAGGFIHQQDFGLDSQGAGNAQALLLAAGKAHGALFEPVADLVPQRRAAQGFFNDKKQALWCIVVLCSWKGCGYWMMFLMAGIKNIDSSVYEAAKMDGASYLRTIWSIVIPLMKRVFLFVCVANTSANMLLFAPMQLVTEGGPRNSTNVLMYEAYRSAFRYADMPRCAVIVTVLLAILVAISVFQFFALGDNEARAAKRAARKLARGGVAV